LLVLDNLEHLEGASAIVAEILRAAPHIKLLATSRSKLNLTGETVLTLAGLDITWDHPDEAMQASGVQLFNEAAKRSNPSFILLPDDLDALAEILQMVGGMPLGIMLAAAWVDMLPVREIAAEIRKNFDFLETEMQDLPDRQRSVRAVFDYSWGLLRPEECLTFSALSVFRGGFSREAAKAVTGTSLRNLANLVNKALVTANPETGRYAVHELLRQYAAAELARDSDRNSQVCDAHADYFAEFMGECTNMMSHGQQKSMFALIGIDIENIRIAWRHHVTQGNVGQARKFVLGLFMIYEIRGWYRSSDTLFNQALEQLPDDLNDDDLRRLRALVQAVGGWSITMQSQPEAGRVAAAQATELLSHSANTVDYWIAVQCLALSLAYLGSVDEMASKLDEAITCYDSLDDPFWAASLRDWRAFAAVLGGDLKTATKYTDDAISVVESSGEYWVTVWNLWLQAMIATQEDRPEDAIVLYTRQAAICHEISFVRGAMVSMDGLGEANVAAGRLEAAEQAFTEGMATASQMGMVRDVLSMMTKVARVWILQDRLIEATELLATVLAEPTSIHQPFTDNIPISETATAALAELEEALGPDMYLGAMSRGTGRSYDVVAREMLIGI
jgi:predicted ATPase